MQGVYRTGLGRETQTKTYSRVNPSLGPNSLLPLPCTNCLIICFPVEGELRVVRSCGWIENSGHLKDRDCFQRTGTKEVRDEEVKAVKPRHF